MNISEKQINFADIEQDLHDIGKKLYLESPDLWIDFCDKVGDNILDEMVLFYATKYNYVSIIKFVADNNILDLLSPSKNKTYSSIKEHLLSVSTDCKSNDVFNFLSGNTITTECKNQPVVKVEEIKEEEEKNKYTYVPSFICPNCKTNVLKTGYKIYEEVSFAFSETTNRGEEISRSKNDKIFCCNCNKVIDNATTTLLENLCSIHHCQKCGKDLIEIGINKKIKMSFNDESNKFNKKEKTYNCSNCDEELNKNQIEYFNL